MSDNRKSELKKAINEALIDLDIDLNDDFESSSQFDIIYTISSILREINTNLEVNIITTDGDWRATINIYKPTFDNNNNRLTKGVTIVLDPSFEDNVFKSVDDIVDVLYKYELEAQAYKVINVKA